MYLGHLRVAFVLLAVKTSADTRGRHEALPLPEYVDKQDSSIGSAAVTEAALHAVRWLNAFPDQVSMLCRHYRVEGPCETRCSSTLKRSMRFAKS